MGVRLQRLAEGGWPRGERRADRLHPGGISETVAPVRSDRWTICGGGHGHWGRWAVQDFSSGTHLRTVRRSICWRSVPRVWTSQAGAEFRAARCEKGSLPSGQRDARHSKSWACSPPICVPERKNKLRRRLGVPPRLRGGGRSLSGIVRAADRRHRLVRGRRHGSLPLDPGISRWLAGRG
jgi:hypothetical protein